MPFPPHNVNRMLLEVLSPLCLHYPQTNYSPEQLMVLAQDWCEDLAGFSFEVVCEAVRLARREERFFPNVATITAWARKTLSQRRSAGGTGVAALPQRTHSEEEMHQGAVSSRMVLLSLENPEARRFFQLQDWADKHALARKLLGRDYPPRPAPGSRQARDVPNRGLPVTDAQGFCPETCRAFTPAAPEAAQPTNRAPRPETRSA